MLPITPSGATISLAMSPGSLVRFTFHGARGRTCTCTDPLLRRMSLLDWTTRAFEFAPGRDCTGTEPGLSRLPLLLGYGSDKDGPHGRTRTRTDSGLSGAPLLIGLHGVVSKWCSRQESRLQPPRSKRGALYIELREPG